MSSVPYSPNDNIAISFYNHACLGMRPEIQPHERNLIEKIGDAGLWPLENLPIMAMNLIKDPKVTIIALTSLAMLVDSYGFYPEETSVWVKAAWALLPVIPFWAVKFSAYVGTMEIIASFGLRAQGRFSNSALMENFYKNPINEGSVTE